MVAQVSRSSVEAAQDEMSERLAAVSEERDTYERETARQIDNIDSNHSNNIASVYMILFQ